MKAPVSIVLLLLFFAGCAYTETTDCTNKACTEVFKTIAVTILDSDQNQVALDSFKVINLENGNDLTRIVHPAEFEAMMENGTYPLFGDEFVQEFRNKKVEINFKGFRDNLEIVNSNYTVGADCCHVILISGEPEISI